MSEHTLEKDWITEAGLRACVLFVNDSHRCGYVGVPAGHKLHGVSYNRMYENEIYLDVHGGLTFSESGNKYPVENDGLYWFGFDCAHSGDATKYYSHPGDIHRSLTYCVGECESLARQLNTIVVPPTAEEQIADLQQKLAKAEELVKYAQHLPKCATRYPSRTGTMPCDCGLYEAVSIARGV